MINTRRGQGIELGATEKQYFQLVARAGPPDYKSSALPAAHPSSPTFHQFTLQTASFLFGQLQEDVAWALRKVSPKSSCT